MKIGYARVSTPDQNLDLQEDDLKKYGCEKIFIDKQSGSTKDRPGLIEALSYLREGDVLVVWRLDRLARSLKDLIAIVTQLNDKNINLLSLKEGIDTDSINGILIFHIFGALAQFERALIQERSAAGLKAARARGRIGGRPKKLSPQDAERLRLLMKEPSLSIHDLKKMFGIGTTSLYKYAKAA